MHTVRNRISSKPTPPRRKPHAGPAPNSGNSGPVLPGQLAPGALPQPPFLLGTVRSVAPSAAFPADLILPPHRGAIITAAAWPAGLIPAPMPAAPPLRAPLVRPFVPGASPQQQPGQDRPRRDPSREAPAHRAPDRPPDRASERDSNRGLDKTARKAERRALVTAELARRAARVAHEAALRQAPPLAQPPGAAPSAPPAAPEPPSAPPALEEPPTILWVGPDDRSPLPRSRAPALPRQGLLDAVAASLGDAGRFLAAMLPGSRKARELRERVARTEARLRAMEAQLAALEALRERVKA